MDRIKKILLFSGYQKEIKSELFGDSYWVNKKNLANLDNTKFTSDLVYSRTWSIGETVRFLIKIPSGQARVETNGNKFVLRESSNVYIYFGLFDRVSLRAAPEPNFFTTTSIKDLKGNDLDRNNLPHDVWIEFIYTCNTAGIFGNSKMTLQFSGVDGVQEAIYYLRGISFGSDLLRADEIDINNKTWISSSGTLYNFTNSADESKLPEVVELKV